MLTKNSDGLHKKNYYSEKRVVKRNSASKRQRSLRKHASYALTKNVDQLYFGLCASLI